MQNLDATFLKEGYLGSVPSLRTTEVILYHNFVLGVRKV